LPSRVQCFNGTCVASRDGLVCIYCGRTLRTTDEALASGAGEPIDPNDPNYWIYLMHDLEVIAEPIAPPTNAGLSFYGKRPNRKAS
jgi:hypothetical protein